ncbi:MAG: hypothetical protein ACOWW1_05670 [archaeon]
MPRLNRKKINVKGIPENLDVLKCTEVVPVKLPGDVKSVIPEPKSEWIRGLIYKELKHLFSN